MDLPSTKLKLYRNIRRANTAGPEPPARALTRPQVPTSEQLERFSGLILERQGHNLALTVVNVPFSIDKLKLYRNIRRANTAGPEPPPRALTRPQVPRPSGCGRCGVNMAHIRQSRPDSGLGVQAKVRITF